MSEQELSYIHSSLFDPHRRTPREPEVIATAFVDCFGSPAGRIVWEYLYDHWAMAQIADERGIGLHDAFLQIEWMIGQGLQYREPKWIREEER